MSAACACVCEQHRRQTIKLCILRRLYTGGRTEDGPGVVSGGPAGRLVWSFRREMVVRELQSMNGFSAPTMCQVLFSKQTGKGPYPQELTFQ